MSYNMVYDVQLKETLQEIVERIEFEILDGLSDSGDDWFTAGKINDAIDIINEYI